MHILIALAIAVALGGGVTLAAEQSKPGDTLYTVKTHVNDEVRAMIDTDSETNIDANVGVGLDASVR